MGSRHIDSVTVMLSSPCTETKYSPFCESVPHQFRGRSQVRESSFKGELG